VIIPLGRTHEKRGLKKKKKFPKGQKDRIWDIPQLWVRAAIFHLADRDPSTKGGELGMATPTASDSNQLAISRTPCCGKS